MVSLVARPRGLQKARGGIGSGGLSEAENIMSVIVVKVRHVVIVEIRGRCRSIHIHIRIHIHSWGTVYEWEYVNL